MKLIIFVAVIAWSNGAKLDKTYLPPHAQTSGGSGNFLETPISGPSSNDYQRNSGLTQNTRGPSRNAFARDGNDYNQAGNSFNQAGNGAGNRFDQAHHSTQGGNNFVNNFAQNGNSFEQRGKDYSQTGNFEGRPERTQAAFERNAAILRQDTQNDGETYAFAYETENGIVAEESGVATNGVEAQGGFSYTGDDGHVYSIRYTADQNGFVPQGDHIPTPPPVPEEILRALEQNARDEAAGIYDDGSYNEAKYGSVNYSGNNYNNGNNYNGNNDNGNSIIGNNFNGNNYNDAGVTDDEDTVVTNSALLRSSNQPGFRSQQSFNNAGPNGYKPGLRNQAVPGNTNYQGVAARSQESGANKAYLPPFPSQRGQNVFGRRQQSFNTRNGYQY